VHLASIEKGRILQRLGRMPLSEIFPAAYWEERLPDLARAYAGAEPFPHVVLDNFLAADRLSDALAEFPGPDTTTWKQYRHFNAQKLGKAERASFPPTIGAIIDTLNGARFLTFLSALTGIRALLPDAALEGGGMHQSLPGGFLNVHADFTAHPSHEDWRRRVNVLVYLNEDWQPSYGGDLELWSTDMSRCVKSVAPIFNRCVVFNTDKTSFHGHPRPLACPPGRTRRSLATYYYTRESQRVTARSTNYSARPDDRLVTSAMMRVNTWALELYGRARRRVAAKR
jgi:Rps23 Pro-64 3,4-dihydroxylase Tpa1-like proline 4-hydroxylase